MKREDFEFLLSLADYIRESLSRLDDCATRCAGDDLAVVLKTRNALQRTRSALVTGLNGYPGIAKTMTIFNEEGKAYIEKMLKERMDSVEKSKE